MASSTTNYHFTLPADSDPASQTPYNENFTSLDTILKTQEDGITAVTPELKSTTIDNTALAALFEGIVTGELDAEITGSSALAGVVRAYKTSSADSIQIAVAIDGTRVTRYYTGSAWSGWIENGGSGGGFTPTYAQLAAMNSGIDSTKVAQIEKNKDNITSEQAKTTGMSEGDSNYITVGGIRVYVSATAPTGANVGDLWIGG